MYGNLFNTLWDNAMDSFKVILWLTLLAVVLIFCMRIYNTFGPSITKAFIRWNMKRKQKKMLKNINKK